MAVHKNIELKELIIHLIFWVGGILFLTFDNTLRFGALTNDSGTFLIPLISGSIINAIIFYGVALRLIPALLTKKSYTKFTLWLIAAYLILSHLEYLIDITLLGNFYYPDRELLSASRDAFIESYAVNFIFIVLSFTYRFGNDWYKNERLRTTLQREALRTELGFLKSQINPHLLFNTLNTLFAMARSEKALNTSKGIAQLANLMRYNLYETNAEYISLESEINCLQNFLKLQNLRFEGNPKLTIESSFIGDFDGIFISPMLLIPFVENAFKHGISNAHKSHIIVKMVLENSYMHFSIANSIHPSSENELDGGIGLRNVRKRLDLIYPDRYDLTIEEKETEYKIKLGIDLTVE